MSTCALVEGCIFFNDKMAEMPSMASLYKQRYCLSGPDNCARYTMVQAVGRENVPSDLYPNDIERAQALISA